MRHATHKRQRETGGHQAKPCRDCGQPRMCGQRTCATCWMKKHPLPGQGKR
jgi:hypothetical protein